MASIEMSVTVPRATTSPGATRRMRDAVMSSTYAWTVPSSTTMPVSRNAFSGAGAGGASRVVEVEGGRRSRPPPAEDERRSFRKMFWSAMTAYLSRKDGREVAPPDIAGVAVAGDDERPSRPDEEDE